MQEKIKSEDISVVLQGPIHETRTKKCLKSIRQQLPNAQIILSTWEGSNTYGLDFDVLILNKDPGAVQQKKFTSKVQLNNMNRMVLSTNKGLEKAERKYTLKLRTDCFLDNTNFLNMFDDFSSRTEKYKLFEHRILASTLFSKYAVNEHNKQIEIPFHVSDWWFFGLTSDIKKLLLSSELVEEPYFSNYFEAPQNAHKKSIFKKFDWRWAPEQHIGYSCFSKYYDDIRMEDCSDISEIINQKSRLCLANNFIFLEYKQSGIRNLKYTCSKYEPFSGDQYLDLYNFYNFELEYRKYCDPSYIPTLKNIIISNRDIGYRLLRFYKHFYKLFDPEAPIPVKLEQLFIGIPFSGITLIPTLFKIIKEKV